MLAHDECAAGLLQAFVEDMDIEGGDVEHAVSHRHQQTGGSVGYACIEVTKLIVAHNAAFQLLSVVADLQRACHFTLPE